MSLRARLLVAFLVPTLVVLALVGVVSTLTLRHQLVSQVDERLAAADYRATETAQGYGPPSGAPQGGDEDGDGDGDEPDFLDVRGQGAGTLTATVVDGECTTSTVLGDRFATTTLTAAQGSTVAAVDPGSGPRTVDLGGDLGDYRVVASRTPDGDVIVTGLPLQGANQALRILVAVEVLVGLLGLVAAALAATVVIRRTLRPLDRVAATATRVSELQLATGEVTLAERVPPGDTDTRTEVGQVGTALNRLLDHVEGSLTARQASETQVRQFVADASHELRTPLASIRGYAELVRRQHTDVQPEVGHALRRVESEAVRMSVLVEELLLLARLDAGRDLSLGEVDLAALVVDTVSDAHVAGPDHHWRVDLPDAGVLVPGDPVRLHQVLANLLANARTHTPEGTTATVRLRTEAGWAVLQVVDDGPGIPPQLVAHVFERFARGDSSRSRQAGSTGLGLAIVDAVVTAHHGTVSVASEPGRTVFTLRLPHATEVAREADPESLA
ncbi:histidine kinase [Geodermatophilus sp. Leaf369]|nr:histidine kinase [Geodermatophilus sp. Leaf369]